MAIQEHRLQRRQVEADSSLGSSFSFDRSLHRSPTRKFVSYLLLKLASSRLSELSCETKTGELALGRFGSVDFARAWSKLVLLFFR